MTTIVVTGIDETKPVAGTPTTSSVRDNFAEIKTQFTNAGNDIDDLADGTTTHTNFRSTGIDDNADALAITIDASENVGIGESSPARSLDINHSGDYGFRIGAGAALSYDIGRDNVSGLLEFYANQATANGYVFGGVDGTALTLDSSLNATFGGDVTVQGNDIHVGSNGGNARYGQVSAYGQATGSTAGGQFAMFTADDHDTTVAHWRWQVREDNCDLVASGVGNALIFDNTLNATFGGNVSLADSNSLYLGAGNDLDLYHNGTNSHIVNNTNVLYLQNKAASQLIRFEAANSSAVAKTAMTLGGATPNVSLYYDGSAVLNTTPDGFNVNNDANFALGFIATSPVIYMDAGDYFGYVRASNYFTFNPGGVESVRFDASVTAGQTRLLVYDVDNATTERVTVGAADSGGAGYKVLRIPN